MINKIHPLAIGIGLFLIGLGILYANKIGLI